MPRSNRCVLAGLAYHVTQRGVDQRETFSSDGDRLTYLRLLRHERDAAGVKLLAWCLMSNHVHLVAIPVRDDSLAVLLRRVHGRYAQYYNARAERIGHLWQSRYFSCPLGPTHFWRALIYVETNPVRAGLVEWPEQYRWSSVAAHVAGRDLAGLLDMDWWARESPAGDWAEMLRSREHDCREEIERCTYAGRPFGEEGFVQAMSQWFGRHWERGRPKKPARSAAVAVGSQGSLW